MKSRFSYDFSKKIWKRNSNFLFKCVNYSCVVSLTRLNIKQRYGIKIYCVYWHFKNTYTRKKGHSAFDCHNFFYIWNQEMCKNSFYCALIPDCFLLYKRGATVNGNGCQVMKETAIIHENCMISKWPDMISILNTS